MVEYDIVSNTQMSDEQQLLIEIRYFCSYLFEPVRKYDEIGICITETRLYFAVTMAGMVLGKTCYMLHPGCGTNTLERLAGHNILFVTDQIHFDCERVPSILIEKDRCRSGVLDTYAIPDTWEQFLHSVSGKLCFQTSGTTSMRSHFVELSFQWLVTKSVYLKDFLKLSSEDVGIVFSSCCFIQVFWTILSHLLADAKLVFVSFSIKYILETISKEQVTSLVCTASVLRGLITVEESKSKLVSIRKVVTGGDYMDSLTLKRLLSVIPEIKYSCIYGCTEISAVNIMLPLCELKNMDLEQDIPIGSCGPYSEICLINDKGENGTYGEIYCKTALSPMRYIDCPDLFVDNNGYFHTGDLARKDKLGNYYFLGRKTSVINYNGQKINSFEVENEISGWKEIKENVVIAEKHELYGEIAVCYIIPNSNITVDEICERLSGIFEPYKIPKRIHIVDKLPRTVSGKVIRYAAGYNGEDSVRENVITFER